MGVKIRFLKGAWWVVIHQHGRRKMKRVGDRETADRVARAIRERLAHGDLHLTPAATDHTLKTYATSWLAMMQATLKASTVTFYQGHLTQHILPALGSQPVPKIRRADCRQLVFTCRSKGLQVATVRGIVRTLSTILSQAVDDELLVANPALRLGKYLRHADDPEPRIDPFTREEASHVLDTAACSSRTGIRGCSRAFAPACARANCSGCSGATSTGVAASCWSRAALCAAT